MSEDRRATIEAALNAGSEQDGQTADPAPVPTPAPAPVERAAPQDENSPSRLETEGVDTTPAPAPAEGSEDVVDDEKPVKTYAVDKAPQSWRPAQKAKWGKLDPDIRQEVIRRERDTERLLGETAQARQLSNAFTQTVAPYMARIQSMGVHPVAAIGELLKADHVLTTAPKGKRAEFMAKLIKDYDVDIESLDSALAGQPQRNPVESQVEALLQQRLAPFQNYMNQQEQARQAAIAQQQQKAVEQIQNMASDPVKFPEYENVREDMADIIEIQAKKGVYLSPEQAYTRAVAMNSGSGRQAADPNNANQLAAARAANARAQRAKGAAASVGGAPNGGVGGGQVQGKDRRSTIAAALDQSEGR